LKYSKVKKNKIKIEYSNKIEDKDACVTPVLDINRELGQFEHHNARGTFKFDEMSGNWIPRAAPIVMGIEEKNGNMKSKL
jgi:hypothetical protein